MSKGINHAKTAKTDGSPPIFHDRDGALGSWGAALLEPYSDRPDEYGTMRSPEQVWEPLIDSFVSNVSPGGIPSISMQPDLRFSCLGMASGKLHSKMC